MDGYPPAYVAHNLPLLIVSGLGSAQDEPASKDGILISSEIPSVETEDAETLLRHLKQSNASNMQWNGREHTGRNKFRVQAVGRVV
jgi:trafficking protein particle complex subunit 11